MDACGSCGERNPDRARFCLGCGRPLRALDEVRKHVTVLFTDVVGSTTLGATHDPERYRQVLTRYFERIEDAVVRHGGTVEKFIGDAVMAIFGVPVAHEDDALRAVRAADELRHTVRALAADGADGGLVLRWRTGLATGEVSAGGPGGHTFATGDAVNLAARLQQLADPDEVLLDDATYDLVRDAVEVADAGTLSVRGRPDPVSARRLVSVAPRAAGRRRRFDQPFVGHADELELLAWALRRARTPAAGPLVTVHGDAGVGKTRLVARSLEGASLRVAWGRCLPYGDGVTYWPLAESLAGLAGLDLRADEATTLDRLTTLAGGRLPRRTVAAVAGTLGLTGDPVDADPAGLLRRYLAAVAGTDGLVLVVDDVHEAEPALLDLLTDVARARTDALLLVVVGRRELLEHRPTWAGGVPDALSVSLGPLSAGEAGTLLESLLPEGVEPLLARRLVDAAGGNPLLLEELVTLLRERGHLRHDAAGRWTPTDPAAPVPVSASVQSLLTARVDTLAPEDRTLLGRAAVCGTEFTLAGLAELTPAAERDELEARLTSLVDRELLTPRRGGYAFRHHAARDAVYSGLPRRRRADLHERYAAALDAAASSPQSDEFVAYHLDRALAERAALDADDPGLQALRADVGARLDRAGHRAFARGDAMAAARLLGRALTLASVTDDRERVRLLTTRARALATAGALEVADEDLSAALAAADRLGDPVLRTHTRITALWIRSNLDLAGWVDEARTVAHEALGVFERANDVRGLSRAWGLTGEVHYLLAAYEEATAAMGRAERYARAAGDEVEADEAAVARAFGTVLGPTHLDDVIATCDGLLDEHEGDRYIEARVLQIRASAAAMLGDVPGARRSLASAVERFEELGQGYWLATSVAVEGTIATLADDPADAEQVLRRAVDALVGVGDAAQAATVAARLALLLPADRTAELEELVAFATEHAHPDDLEARVRAELAAAHLDAAHGEQDAALARARTAVERAGRSDGPVLRADAHLELARLLHRAGEHGAARRAAADARDHYVAKGHAVGAARARAIVGPAAEVG